MAYRILIAGAGQLGSRYLQGLVKYDLSALDVYVYDISNVSLNTALDRWLEVSKGESIHSIKFIDDLNTLPKSLDIAIVSSTADFRLEIIRKILHYTNVSNWILEKILVQSLGQVEVLNNLLSKSHCWVNTPMHMWSLYKKLTPNFRGRKIHASFSGIPNLACNAIHYIDYISRINNTDVTSINIDKLSSNLILAKRPGFYEIEGELLVSYADESTLVLSSGTGGDAYKVKIEADSSIWHIFELDGYAEKEGGGDKVSGSAEFQSVLTAPLLKKILTDRACDLPTLSQSIKQHEVFLEAMQLHFSRCGYLSEVVPIT